MQANRRLWDEVCHQDIKTAQKIQNIMDVKTMHRTPKVISVKNKKTPTGTFGLHLCKTIALKKNKSLYIICKTETSSLCVWVLRNGVKASSSGAQTIKYNTFFCQETCVQGYNPYMILTRVDGKEKNDLFEFQFPSGL